MAFKLLFLAAVLAVAQAQLAYSTGYHVPQYSYAYDVNDPFTGDSKSQFETRSGDLVQGQYSLTDPDGTRRTVDYAANDASGFNAVVRKDPLVHAAPVAAYSAAYPYAYSAAAPLAYSAPAYGYSGAYPYGYSALARGGYYPYAY